MDRWGNRDFERHDFWDCETVIGVVSPNILKRINTRRVQLEHYHEKPKNEEVTDFLDITELFIELFKFRTHRIELLIDYDQDFAFWMDLEKNEIRIYDNAKFFLHVGGAHMFKEVVEDKGLKPIETIPISDLNLWTATCSKYIRQ